jgi:acyl-CoA reductase-like NAD-dependent aldehyde dehydrogenase
MMASPAAADGKNWTEAARALAFDARPFVDGKPVDPQTDSLFAVENAFTADVLTSAPDCAEADVNRAVAAARRSFESGVWSRMPVTERSRILRRWADLVAASTELAMLQSLQMGMPIAIGLPDMQAASDVLRDAADLADQLNDVLLPGGPSALMMEIRRPHGVVAIISPWNFPTGVALTMIAPALAAGNSVVLKPSEIAPLECLKLAQQAAEAGVPPGVFNVITGTGANTGRLLALHMDVDMLSFTGSTATGQLLMQYAGQSNLKALVLECGGKSPQIVFDDVGDIEALADVLFEGFTFNSGQVCTSSSRTLVAASLYDRLVPLLAARVEASQTGNPLDPSTRLGPLANRAQANRLRTTLGVEDPAVRLIAKGQVSGHGPNEFAPHLFETADQSSRLVQDEVFGPLSVISRFHDEDEAIRLANGTRYGLSAIVYSSDVAVSHRLLSRLHTGVVLANRVARPKPSGLRFATVEPVKMSGFGAHGGPRGLATYTRVQAAILNME